MKTLNIFSVILITIGLAACREAGDDVANPSSESEQYQSIGEEIPYETGMKWMARYKKRMSNAGRTESSAYYIPLPELDAMLGSVGNITGVAFHYGLDESGTEHVMAVPVDSTLSLWPSNSTQVIIDANSGTVISQSQANDWGQRYGLNHPEAVWFHFFGKDIFYEMKAIPNLQGLDLEPALDEQGALQLLMVVWEEDSSSAGGRLALLARIFDASNACPPCAVR